jgi:membrane fusion protein (multidrug efflux system)
LLAILRILVTTQFMKLKHILVAIFILLLGAFITYRIIENSSEKNNEKDKGKNKMPAKVTGVILQPQAFSDQLSLSGSIEANEQVDIRSEVSGIVESINFNEGTNVSKGQILFKVNDLELRAQLGKARTAQNLAGENARRAQLLLNKEAISREEFDIATADFKSAQSETQLIQAQIAKTTIRAPFAGKIGLRSISKGTYVTPETVVAKLINNSNVKITFSVPEKYSSQMRDGNTITFNVAGAKEKYTAKIYALEPEVDVSTRTLRVRALAANNQGKLLPGTFANVMLPLDKITDALFVPTQALIPIQNGKKVFIAQGGKAKEVIVETGARTEKNILITEGLKPGDTVLTTGVMSLKDGAPVKVKVN